MARNPILNATDRGRAAAQQMREAVSAARGRVGGEGRLVVFAAVSILSAFVLLALLAPVLMRAPGFVSYLVAGLLFGLIVVGTGAGVMALWRVIRAGGYDTASQAGPLNAQVVEAALSEAEDCGLKAVGPRMADDAITGRIAGRPVVIARCAGRTYGVVRLKNLSKTTILVAPGGAQWPFALPPDGALTPIAAPINGLAWATDREAGEQALPLIRSALVLAEGAGQAPHTCLRAKALVMMWASADVGSAALIVGEAAKQLKDF